MYVCMYVIYVRVNTYTRTLTNHLKLNTREQYGLNIWSGSSPLRIRTHMYVCIHICACACMSQHDPKIFQNIVHKIHKTQSLTRHAAALRVK
jgi:hypothetical protein